MTRPRSEAPHRPVVERAIALDANGAVPCTCAAIRATFTFAMWGGTPPSSLLGWHYDACARTVAALREVTP